MYSSCDCKRLRRMLEILRYIRDHPMRESKEISEACRIHPATFFRFLYAVGELRVKVSFIEQKKKRGYKVVSWGIINRKAL